MARKKVRKVHIEDDVWHYVVKLGYYSSSHVNIYGPDKKLYQIHVFDISGEQQYDTSAYFSDSYKPDLKVTPSKIKDYIIKNLISK